MTAHQRRIASSLDLGGASAAAKEVKLSHAASLVIDGLCVYPLLKDDSYHFLAVDSTRRNGATTRRRLCSPAVSSPVK